MSFHPKVRSPKDPLVVEDGVDLLAVITTVAGALANQQEVNLELFRVLMKIAEEGKVSRTDLTAGLDALDTANLMLRQANNEIKEFLRES